MSASAGPLELGDEARQDEGDRPRGLLVVELLLEDAGVDRSQAVERGDGSVLVEVGHCGLRGRDRVGDAKEDAAQGRGAGHERADGLVEASPTRPRGATPGRLAPPLRAAATRLRLPDNDRRPARHGDAFHPPYPGGRVSAPDPAEVRRLVAAVVDRVLGPATPAAARPDEGACPGRGAGAPRAHRRLDEAAGRRHPARRRRRRRSPRAPRAPARRRRARPVADPARTVAIGGDHGGFALKQALAKYVREDLRWAVIDCGTHSTEPVDYPDIAKAVGEAVAERPRRARHRHRRRRHRLDDGGESRSRRALRAVPRREDGAQQPRAQRRQRAGAGFGRSSTRARPAACVEVWLKTKFAGGRHARRVEKIMELERLRALAPERSA